MTIIAGIDIGNSTTELLLARVGRETAEPVYATRTRTVGEKGSLESLMGAVRLLERAEKDCSLRCEAIALAHLHPVRTLVAEFPCSPVSAAPVRTLTVAGPATPSGSGLVHGAHVPMRRLDGPSLDQDVVVSVPMGTDFEDASGAISSALAGGWRIVGAIVAGDDAVLIGNRLPVSIPIVDEASVENLVEAEKIAVEVAAPGETIGTLNDPLAIAAMFDLPAAALRPVARLARELSDARSAALAIGVCATPAEECGADEGWIEVVHGGRTMRYSLANVPRDFLRQLPPGSVRALHPPSGSNLGKAVEGCEAAVRDLYVADLPGLGERGSVRRGSARFDASPVSIYVEGAAAADPEAVMGSSTGRPVTLVSSESEAARRGALTTPAAPLDAAVCDIGGGTIDVVVADRASVVAAGAGELLTISVAFALGVTRGLAEYVKRSPSVRVETPYLVRHEDGGRDFLSRPATGAAVGRLCTRRRDAFIPFSDALSPEEWRTLRLSIKSHVIASNIARCLATLRRQPRVMLLCGGPAEDKELVRIVGDWMGARGMTAGRTNVGGRFGPRYAVALGLVLLMSEQE